MRSYSEKFERTAMNFTILRSEVPNCLEKYENLPNLYFEGIYQKLSLHNFEDIILHIVLAKFYDNLTLTRRVDSI